MKHLEIKKYWKLFAIQLHMALNAFLAYRKDFIFSLGSTFAYVITYLAFLSFLLNRVHAIAGWDFNQMLILTGVSQIWVSYYYLFLFNNASNLVKSIRNGTFDFLLLKPANLQFLIHNLFDVMSLVIAIEGFIMFCFAFHNMHTIPGLLDALQFILLLAISMHIAFNVQRIINVAYIIFPANSTFYYFLADVFQLSMYPYEIYNRVMFFILSFGVPSVIFINLPARALLGILSWKMFLYMLLIEIFFWLIASLVWKRALFSYTSSGG